MLHVSRSNFRPVQKEEPLDFGVRPWVVLACVFKDGVLCGEQWHNGYLVLHVAKSAPDPVPELVVRVNSLKDSYYLHPGRGLGCAADRGEDLQFVARAQLY